MSPFKAIALAIIVMLMLLTAFTEVKSMTMVLKPMTNQYNPKIEVSFTHKGKDYWYPDMQSACKDWNQIYNTVRERVRRNGWSWEDALTIPVNEHTRARAKKAAETRMKNKEAKDALKTPDVAVRGWGWG